MYILIAVCIEIKGVTRLSAPILEATFFEIACMCSFQDRFSSMFSQFAMICLVYFDALYINIYCLVI